MSTLEFQVEFQVERIAITCKAEFDKGQYNCEQNFTIASTCKAKFDVGLGGNPAAVWDGRGSDEA